jgi:hypothetical protein
MLGHMAGSGYKTNLGILALEEREELKKSLEAEGSSLWRGSGFPLKFDRGARNGYTSGHE